VRPAVSSVRRWLQGSLFKVLLITCARRCRWYRDLQSATDSGEGKGPGQTPASMIDGYIQIDGWEGSWMGGWQMGGLVDECSQDRG
jgi:hypothetical protein